MAIYSNWSLAMSAPRKIGVALDRRQKLVTAILGCGNHKTLPAVTDIDVRTGVTLLLVNNSVRRSAEPCKVCISATWNELDT